MGISSAKAQINFVSGTYEEALAKASAEGKLLFIDFRADWCKPCLEMEKTTFQDVDLGNYMADNFISYKVDVDYFDGMDLQEKFNASVLPTLLVIDPIDEAVQLRLIGLKTKSELETELKKLRNEPIVVVEPTPTETEPAENPSKRKCFLRRWLDKITE